MKGYFDDFKVYDVVLTAEDVKVAMNEPAGGAVEEVRKKLLLLLKQALLRLVLFP